MNAVPSHSLVVKICGLKTAEAVDAALAAGADMVGLVSFPASPRHVDATTAAALADRARGRAEIVLLTVDADDAALAGLVSAIRPDWLQLHGKESPERVSAVRRRFGLAVMKALGVREAGDLAVVPGFAAVADRLLFDAKPPRDATRPGGNGLSFDWRLLAALDPAVPFMLSGGLGPETVAEAVRLVRPFGVDVSSGVERAPGEKDVDLIGAFVRAARAAESTTAETTTAESLKSGETP
jgi:phosphoribosylanthranilate isomerase